MKKFVKTTYFCSVLVCNLTGSESILMDTIPFKLTEHNNIVIEAVINKNDTFALMFHSDISSVSLTTEASSRLRSMGEIETTNAESWAGSKELKVTENNEMKIGQLEWQELDIYYDLLSGIGTDGKFGPNLFENFLIEINYDHNILVLHDRIDFIVDTIMYQTIVLSTNENGSLFIEGEIDINDQIVRNKYLIHTGYSGTIIIDDDYYLDNEILHNLEVVKEKELKDSFGNIIKTKTVEVEGLKMCNRSFEDVPISYFDSELNIQKISVVGGELLKRFNMIFDIENLRLHVCENVHSKVEFSNS